MPTQRQRSFAGCPLAGPLRTCHVAICLLKALRRQGVAVPIFTRWKLSAVEAQPASDAHQLQRSLERSRETSCSCPLVLFPPCITVSSEATAIVTSCHLSRPMLETLAPNSREHHSLCIQVVKGYLTQCVPSWAV